MVDDDRILLFTNTKSDDRLLTCTIDTFINPAENHVILRDERLSFSFESSLQYHFSNLYNI